MTTEQQEIEQQEVEDFNERARRIATVTQNAFAFPLASDLKAMTKGELIRTLRGLFDSIGASHATVQSQGHAISDLLGKKAALSSALEAAQTKIAALEKDLAKERETHAATKARLRYIVGERDVLEAQISARMDGEHYWSQKAVAAIAALGHASVKDEPAQSNADPDFTPGLERSLVRAVAQAARDGAKSVTFRYGGHEITFPITVLEASNRPYVDQTPGVDANGSPTT